MQEGENIPLNSGVGKWKKSKRLRRREKKQEKTNNHPHKHPQTSQISPRATSLTPPPPSPPYTPIPTLSWAGGPFPTLGSPNASFSSYLTSTSSMLSSNLTSAVFAAGLASRYLPPSGTLVLTGASASLSPSSCSNFMPGYGLSKMGVTNLANMLREEVEFKVVVVHPGTIDTKANRDAMPDANFDEWNSTEGIARGVREVRGMFLFPRRRRHFGNAQRGCSLLSQTHTKNLLTHTL